MPGTVFTCLSVKPDSKQHIRTRHGIQLLVSEASSGNISVPGTVFNCLSTNQAQGNISVPGAVFSSLAVNMCSGDI